MKVGMPITYAGDFRETIAHLRDFESVGLDRVMVPEAYGFDAVSQLGFAAATTERVELAFGILPMFSRSPTNLAMTAAGLDYISNGRCVLGLGASGPQVVEGFHGIKYDAPLGRAREHVDICRTIWRREKSEYHGQHYHLPLTEEDGGSGLGKPLRMMNRPLRDRIPMLLAAIGPKNVALAAEIFDEWQPFLFHPELAELAFGEALASGRAKRDPELGDLGIAVQTFLLITDDENAQSAALQGVRNHVALYVGGMGAKGKNFYNTLFSRYGFAAEAEAIQALYLQGKKEEAAAAVPQDFVRSIALIGSAEHIEARLSAYRAAGVSCLIAEPLAETHAERVDHVGQLKSLTG
ncbi:LLM class F420-dependent oxidoreductase [Mycolicibacterium komossense]|uniref:LLM class F420-dependent oxidoreductase n=1 Tax=Mycolicibacterium komossense TaxID=1779 RepID=A0ABT3CAF8_9MYCO|nr:LLM class F420-dependent oxidoreductase [Mycolicibacterium komossense]MCV7226464.1 LLM class F420-dependent oxidoreductase [Mycolicibacterium komossense]